MKLESWFHFYTEICRDLGIDPDLDRKSARILSGILGKNSRLELLEPYRHGTFYVVGNGPNLAEGLREIGNGTVIVADSALGTYMKHFPSPDIVVTDLDGNMNDLEVAYRSGSVLVIHAHGDNIPKIKEHAGKFMGRAVGSTQNVPLENVYNFFGFTDGDRGAYLAHFLNAEKIYLVGFDFERVGEKAGVDIERKLKKLKWAKLLLGALAKERKTVLGEGPIILL